MHVELLQEIQSNKLHIKLSFSGMVLEQKQTILLKLKEFLLTWPAMPVNKKASTENLTAFFLYRMNLERLSLLSTIHLQKERKPVYYLCLFFSIEMFFVTNILKVFILCWREVYFLPIVGHDWKLICRVVGPLWSRVTEVDVQSLVF